MVVLCASKSMWVSFVVQFIFNTKKVRSDAYEVFSSGPFYIRQDSQKIHEIENVSELYNLQHMKNVHSKFGINKSNNKEIR